MMQFDQMFWNFLILLTNLLLIKYTLLSALAIEEGEDLKVKMEQLWSDTLGKTSGRDFRYVHIWLRTWIFQTV